ncbi:MAG TPA: polysaccharide biosynthesis tyrosine autokinase [Candidatus Methylacidiphilales bacterium]|nr:polysaccharide biosynthesis tyrosine autokinase [Candidatus Methylacidiphilales bacterium]
MNSPRKTPSSRASQEKELAPLSLDYEHLGRLALKHWKWLAGGVVGGAVAGLLYAAAQTPAYAATATIVVSERDPNLQGAENASVTDDTSGEMIETKVQLLQTKDLPEEVVKKEHLNENPDFLPSDAPPPVSEDVAAGILMGDATIRKAPLTRVIDITVEHRLPEMAEFLANKLAEQSVLQELEQKTKGARDLATYYQTEVDRLQQKVVEAENALHAYEATHNLPASSDNPNAAVDTQATDLNQQYINAQIQVTELEARYGPENPKLIEARLLVDQLRDDLQKAQANTVTLSSENMDYSRLQSEAASYRQQLESMRKELEIAESAVHVAVPSITVRDEANSAIRVRPNRTKSVAIGGFIGLLGGLGFILGLYFIDNSIRTVSQAESVLSLPVIAAVPILGDSQGKSVLPTYSDPQSFVAESFRGLRASLILHDRENPVKTILVASAIPGEGKSFCAANLAVAFAQAGLKTLLIDADLRLPTLHTYFNFPGESGGFTEVLAGRAKLASAVVASPVPALSLLLTCIPSDSPAELLSGNNLTLLLDEAAATYDRVVIDSAPLNAVSDTMLVMPKADAILLVIRAALTPASECKSALQKISGGKMKPLGLILNYLEPHTLKSYSYGYSYGQKPKEKYAK